MGSENKVMSIMDENKRLKEDIARLRPENERLKVRLEAT